jgi:hypothetical protein
MFQTLFDPIFSQEVGFSESDQDSHLRSRGWLSCFMGDPDGVSLVNQDRMDKAYHLIVVGLFVL